MMQQGRCVTVTDYEGRVTAYQYDENGRLTETQYPNGTVEIITYDDKGQITEQETYKDNVFLAGRTYRYDANGNITYESSEFGSASAVMDLNEQLKEYTYRWKENIRDVYTLTFDAVGNILDYLRHCWTDGSMERTTMYYGSGNQMRTWNGSAAGMKTMRSPM